MVKVKLVDGFNTKDEDNIETKINEALEELQSNKEDTVRRKLVDVKLSHDGTGYFTALIIYSEEIVTEAYNKYFKDEGITAIPWWWPYEPWKYHPSTNL